MNGSKTDPGQRYFESVADPRRICGSEQAPVRVFFMSPWRVQNGPGPEVFYESVADPWRICGSGMDAERM